MEEILRTNDAVAISSAQAILADIGVETYLLDQHMANMEGSIGAIPRRLMVDSDDAHRARRELEQTGLFDGALRPAPS